MCWTVHVQYMWSYRRLKLVRNMQNVSSRQVKRWMGEGISLPFPGQTVKPEVQIRHSCALLSQTLEEKINMTGFKDVQFISYNSGGRVISSCLLDLYGQKKNHPTSLKYRCSLKVEERAEWVSCQKCPVQYVPALIAELREGGCVCLKASIKDQRYTFWKMFL